MVILKESNSSNFAELFLAPISVGLLTVRLLAHERKIQSKVSFEGVSKVQIFKKRAKRNCKLITYKKK